MQVLCKGPVSRCLISMRLEVGYDWSTADTRLVGTHWCVDIGIRDVCREVQVALGCPAVLARYSRLFCDCNRPLPVKAAPAGKSGNAEQGGASAVSCVTLASIFHLATIH